MSEASANGARQRLDSWKAIAAHLGRDVRTVSRWEKERGLPVYRVPGGRVRTVFAYADELDAWLASPAGAAAERAQTNRAGHPVANPASRRNRLRFAAALSIVVALPVATWAVWEFRFAPVDLERVSAHDRTINAIDSSGRAAWSFTPPFPLTPGPPLLAWNAVGDLDGRDGAEVVAAAVGSWEAPDVLYAFSNRGAPLWQRELDGSVTYGGSRFDAPWRSLSVLHFTIDGVPRIAWTTHHQTWSPSILAVMDGTGRVRHRFVHNGWLSSVRLSADGRHLLVAGTRRPELGYALAVLDARDPTGSAPPTDAPRSACEDCPPGQPLRYFILDRSELAALTEAPLYHPFAPVRLIVLPGGAVEVHARQKDGPDGSEEAIYEFGPDFVLRRAHVSDSYWAWHRELERAGKINHAADVCPDRSGLRVREWTRDRGWVAHPVSVK